MRQFRKDPKHVGFYGNKLGLWPRYTHITWLAQKPPYIRCRSHFKSQFRFIALFGIQSLASCPNSLEEIACCKVHSGQCSHVQSFCVEIPCWLMFIVKLFPIWPKYIKNMLIVYLKWPSVCLFSKLSKFIYLILWKILPRLSKICWFCPLVFILCWLMLIVQLCFLCFLKIVISPLGATLYTHRWLKIYPKFQQHNSLMNKYTHYPIIFPIDIPKYTHYTIGDYQLVMYINCYQLSIGFTLSNWIEIF